MTSLKKYDTEKLTIIVTTDNIEKKNLYNVLYLWNLYTDSPQVLVKFYQLCCCTKCALTEDYTDFCPQVMSQAEGQQKNLVHSIDSLPTRGPLSCLDQDLLLLKATSAATLSCLGECLNILQQTQSHSQAPPQSSERSHATQRAPSGESAPGPVPVLLLEPPTRPSPPSLLSFQSLPPEPSTGGTAQLMQLECDSCPCLMAPMNFNVCTINAS